MAYTDDAVLAKLSALNESHDSIATAAQWIMFHRRHADRTVQLWLQRLKDSPSAKRTNLIYLANEVTQQSKVRHKDDFVTAFSPVIAEATATAYKGAPSDYQIKLRRVVDVWRDRGIFEPPIQSAIEARLDELDKSKGIQRPGLNLGTPGSPSTSASIPSELAPIVAAQQKISKLILPLKAATSTVNQDFNKAFDPAVEQPAPPVYVARLTGLLKTLAAAENNVQDCVKARTELVEGLEKLLASSRQALEADESQLDELQKRKIKVETTRQGVEFAIMGGKDLSGGMNGQPAPEPDRPEMEALTPPSVKDEDEPDVKMETSPPAGVDVAIRSPVVPAPGIEMLSNLASTYQSVPVATNGGNKRRRVDSGDEFPDLGDDGIDPDVTETLRQDSLGS